MPQANYCCKNLPFFFYLICAIIKKVSLAIHFGAHDVPRKERQHDRESCNYTNQRRDGDARTHHRAHECHRHRRQHPACGLQGGRRHHSEFHCRAARCSQQSVGCPVVRHHGRRCQTRGAQTRQGASIRPWPHRVPERHDHRGHRLLRGPDLALGVGQEDHRARSGRLQCPVARDHRRGCHRQDRARPLFQTPGPGR